MSGFQGTNTAEGGEGNTFVGLSSGAGSQLTRLMLSDDIVPGDTPSYQTCKITYTYHPLGGKMVDTPIKVMQSQEREITVSGGPETKLIPEFKRVWKSLASVGADSIIQNVIRTARIYGIGSLACGTRGIGQNAPLVFENITEENVYFNTLDPLNTAGSLVLDQDPSSPDFQNPTSITSGGKNWHASRTVVVMNEKPIYIEFTSSAFGFVGRSVYQRALFPMKTFLQSMITDDMVTKKCGLLVINATAPGPVTNNRILNFFGLKRSYLKGGVTGNVITIGEKEQISSLNFQNLEGPAKFARDNALKNIAMAAGMPAKLLEQEEMVGGMAEGTEDAKAIAQYINAMREESQPIYRFMDKVVMRLAWSPTFYKTIQKEFPELYGGVDYKTAFIEWANAFEATWPNLLEEPDSEKIKVEETRFKSVVALLETLVPSLDPENKAAVIAWAVDEINTRRQLFSANLDIDAKKLAKFGIEQQKQQQQMAQQGAAGGAGEGGAKEPAPPKPFSSTS
jgi:hypothetical protein